MICHATRGPRQCGAVSRDWRSRHWRARGCGDGNGQARRRAAAPSPATAEMNGRILPSVHPRKGRHVQSSPETLSSPAPDAAPLRVLRGIDRGHALDWYGRNRARTRALFDVLAPETLYAQPIAQRHPIVFYVGHLPGFSLNTLVKRALGQAGIDERLERLFARGIDPDEDGHDASAFTWPDRETVETFVHAADARVVQALTEADLDQPGHPLLDRAEAVYAILEHEAMHQETLLYMWHRLPHGAKRAPRDYAVRVEPGNRAAGRHRDSRRSGAASVRCAARSPFGWDNEFPGPVVDVDAFRIQRLNVTNGDFLAFVEAGGYRDPQWWSPQDWTWLQAESHAHPSFWESIDGRWHWRGMFEYVPLPMAWPVYVSQAEAAAYAKWTGRRLPTEAEFQRAAYTAPGRDHAASSLGRRATDEGAWRVRLPQLGTRAGRYPS